MSDDRPVTVTGSANPRGGGRPDVPPPAADQSGADQQDGDPLHTVPGAAEARALIRVQLRIALSTCAFVLAVVIGLPALLVLAPDIARTRADGVPLWWLVLALGVQPLWVGVSLWQLRRAERAERGPARRR